MSRVELERLEDIMDAIAAIHEHLAIADEHGWHRSDLVRDALLYNLVIIGEAVKHVGSETTARRPDIQWRQIAGLRDLLAHQYFRIRMEEIDEIVKTHLPQLDAAVKEIIAEEPGE